MDNTAAPVVDNPAPIAEAPVSQPTLQSPQGWKSNLRTELKDSPFAQKFEDTPEGLNKALESYGNLEKLLGHEKIPVPKDDNDVEGWTRYKKAFGVPEKPEGYKLEDYKLPETMKGLTIGKAKFAEVAHSLNMTPAQAAKQWKIYNEVNTQAYEKHVQAHQAKVTEAVNTLRQEWGDKYSTNVELGQSVINQFSDSQEMNDELTASLVSSPAGIKFLANIGEQFSENKVGSFQAKRFALSPEEAKAEIDKIVRDLEGPYMNTREKHTEAEHQAAMERVNSLRAVIARAKG